MNGSSKFYRALRTAIELAPLYEIVIEDSTELLIKKLFLAAQCHEVLWLAAEIAGVEETCKKKVTPSAIRSFILMTTVDETFYPPKRKATKEFNFEEGLIQNRKHVEIAGNTHEIREI